MRLLRIDIEANEEIHQVVSPSDYVYIDRLSAGSSLDIVLTAESGSVVARLDDVQEGSKLKASDIFNELRLVNNASSGTTAFLYVGLGEFSSSKTNLAGSVSTNTASAVSVYSDRKALTTTGVSVKSWLPAGAIVNDVLIQNAQDSSANIRVSSTASGNGPVITPGNSFSASNSFDLYVRSTDGTVNADVIVTYT